MRVFILGLLLPLLAAGCAYNVPVAPSTAAESAVAGKPRNENPVSYALTQGLATLKGDVDQVCVCSSQGYSILASRAIVNAINAANTAALACGVPAKGETIGAGAAGLETQISDSSLGKERFQQNTAKTARI